MPSVFCQKYCDLFADSHVSRWTTLKGASQRRGQFFGFSGGSNLFRLPFRISDCHFAPHLACRTQKLLPCWLVLGSWLSCHPSNHVQNFFRVPGPKFNRSSRLHRITGTVQHIIVLIAREFSGQLASIPNTVKPFFFRRWNSACVLSVGKNSRVPCVRPLPWQLCVHSPTWLTPSGAGSVPALLSDWCCPDDCRAL